MPTFELSTPDGKTFEIDAADIGMAQKAFDHAFGGGASSPAPEAAAAQAAPQPQRPGFSEALAQTWPARLAKDLWSGVTAPGDAITGKLQVFNPETGHVTDEAMARGRDLAGFVSPAAPAGLVPKGPAASEFMGGFLNRPMVDTLTGKPVGDALSNLARRSMVPAAPPALSAGEQATQQAGRLGIELPTFVASDSRATQALGQASRQMPFAGGMVEKAADKLTGELAGKVADVAGSMTAQTGLDRAAVGDRLRGVLGEAVKNVDEVNNAAYRGVREVIDPTKPVKEALAPIQDAFAKILPERMAAGEQGLGKLEPVANLLQLEGGPTFAGLQRARSQLTKAINYDSREGGFQVGDLKRMRTAITDAMEASVRGAAKADPEAAVGAWKAADETFSTNVEALSSLHRALSSPSDEALLNQVLTMGAEKGGNANRLVALQRQVGSEHMQTLGAHLLEQAGKAGDNWSPAKFVTNMDKLSNTAKSVFFPQTRQQVDDLIAVSARWKDQEARFANKSNTGRAVGSYAFGTAVVGTAMVNPLLAIAKAVGGVAGGLTLGSILTKPATARAAVQLAKAQERVATEGTPAALNAVQALQRRLRNLATAEFGSSALPNGAANNSEPIANQGMAYR